MIAINFYISNKQVIWRIIPVFPQYQNEKIQPVWSLYTKNASIDRGTSLRFLIILDLVSPRAACLTLGRLFQFKQLMGQSLDIDAEIVSGPDVGYFQDNRKMIIDNHCIRLYQVKAESLNWPSCPRTGQMQPSEPTISLEWQWEDWNWSVNIVHLFLCCNWLAF